MHRLLCERVTGRETEGDLTLVQVSRDGSARLVRRRGALGLIIEPERLSPRLPDDSMCVIEAPTCSRALRPTGGHSSVDGPRIPRLAIDFILTIATGSGESFDH